MRGWKQGVSLGQLECCVIPAKGYGTSQKFLLSFQELLNGVFFVTDKLGPILDRLQSFWP